MPRRGTEQEERNAALIMTYFHPFTLDPGSADVNVPFLGELCPADTAWQRAMVRWFDGHVLSHESKRYIDNFLAVTRTRPDDEEEVLSDVELSDEELHVSAQNFAECVKTRMGKGPRTDAEDSTVRGDDD